MFEQLKERIKEHEGFRSYVYKDSLGFATIGYGHLVTKEDNYEEGVEYSKEQLEAVFEDDKVPLSDVIRRYDKLTTLREAAAGTTWKR